MTDIYGNPEPRRVYVPVHHYRTGPAATITPYPGLGLLVIAGAVVAFLYVVGLFGASPAPAGMMPSWPSPSAFASPPGRVGDGSRESPASAGRFTSCPPWGWRSSLSPSTST